MNISRLPTEDLALKAPIPIRIRRRKKRYYADCKSSMGLLLEADGKTPSKARDRLAEGVVLQYRVLRQSRRKDDWHRFHKLVLRGMQKFIKEVKAA